MSLNDKQRQTNRVTKFVVTVLAALVVAGCFYWSITIDQDRVVQITESLGLWGPVFITILFTITLILAPTSSLSIGVIAIKLYGFFWNNVLLYIAFLVSSVINFWLARRFGAPLLRWMLGKENFEKFERIAKVNENTLLIYARILGIYVFDFMSYALGLTEVKFKKYFTYTALLTLVPLTINYLVFRTLDFNSPVGLGFFVGSVVVLSAVFTKVFYKILSNPKHQK